MDQAEAIGIAEAARGAHQVPVDHVQRGAEQRIIELGEPQPAAVMLVRDALVWIVRFQKGIAWVELAVEIATSVVVRVQRSRGP